MNSLCFLINSLILFSSRNSKLSYFIYKMILVPLLISVSGSGYMVKVPPADETHLFAESSAYDLEITVTLSATKKAE